MTNINDITNYKLYEIESISDYYRYPNSPTPPNQKQEVILISLPVLLFVGVEHGVHFELEFV